MTLIDNFVISSNNNQIAYVTLSSSSYVNNIIQIFDIFNQLDF